MKQQYLEDHDAPSAYKGNKGLMKEILKNRAKLATGRLSEKETKDIRNKIVQKSDFLNKDLKLDLVVRDEQGNVLTTDK